MGSLSGQQFQYFKKYGFLRIVGSVYAEYLSIYPSASALRNVHMHV